MRRNTCRVDADAVAWVAGQVPEVTFIGVPSMVFVESDGTRTIHSGGIDAMDLLECAQQLALG